MSKVMLKEKKNSNLLLLKKKKSGNLYPRDALNGVKPLETEVMVSGECLIQGSSEYQADRFDAETQCRAGSNC